MRYGLLRDQVLIRSNVQTMLELVVPQRFRNPRVRALSKNRNQTAQTVTGRGRNVPPDHVLIPMETPDGAPEIFGYFPARDNLPNARRRARLAGFGGADWRFSSG